ncbi:MAG: amino acid ABC transporter permease, partial [Proteobacteria bacterium]|nr:amino acid ABC transporter permease [Pseudomonadota bacterium]
MTAAATSSPKALSWIRERFLATPLDWVITFACAYLVWRFAVPAFKWLVLDATVAGSTRADCNPSGACWVLIRTRFDQYMYGFYPPAERWRVNVAGLLLLVAIVTLLWRTMPGRRLMSTVSIFVFPLVGV